MDVVLHVDGFLRVGPEVVVSIWILHLYQRGEHGLVLSMQWMAVACFRRRLQRQVKSICIRSARLCAAHFLKYLLQCSSGRFPRLLYFTVSVVEHEIFALLEAGLLHPAYVVHSLAAIEHLYCFTPSFIDLLLS